MSILKAEIVRVEIEPHPNADRLELAKVKGWQCVVGKNQFKTGDLGIYIPVDSILPDSLVQKLNLKNYNKRLRTIKLRGFISQGLFIPLFPALDGIPAPQAEGYIEGNDVTECLGITKYESPIPIYMGGEQLPEHPSFIKYTDIENFKNFPNAFQLNEEVIITEKLHGTNMRAAKIDGKLFVGSHRCNMKLNENNLYWKAARLLNLEEKLKEGEQIFGEIYGYKIQELHYGKQINEIAIAIFDFMKDFKYLNYEDFIQVCEDRQFEIVPIIYKGSWSQDLIKFSNGNSLLCPSQIREGIVIKPTIEKWSAEVQGRLILKFINDAYLLKNDRTEYH